MHRSFTTPDVQFFTSKPSQLQSHFNGLKTPCAEHLQLQTPNTTITKTIDTGSLNPRIPQTPTLHALAPCITAAVHALDFATCPAVSKRAICSQPLHAMLGVLLRPTGPSGPPTTRATLPIILKIFVTQCSEPSIGSALLWGGVLR